MLLERMIFIMKSRITEGKISFAEIPQSPLQETSEEEN